MPSESLKVSLEPHTVPDPDRLSDPSFVNAIDEITSLLAVICRAPICGLSHITRTGDWFNPEVMRGLSPEFQDYAFDKHALLVPALLIVPDTYLDARFRLHPCVVGEPQIRFYCGIRMNGSSNEPIGTLYVMDREPRGLTCDQQRAVEIVSHQVIAHLKALTLTQERDEYLHRLEASESALGRSEDRLAQLHSIARLGSYEYTVETEAIVWSDEIYSLFDRDISLGPPTIDELVRCCHPDDTQRLNAIRSQATRDGKPYECDVRVRRRDGLYYWTHCNSVPILGPDGGLQRIIGTLMDIHDRKVMEQALRDREAQLVEAQSLAGIGSWQYTIAADSFIWSAEMYRLFDCDPTYGAPSFEDQIRRFHPEDSPTIAAALQNAITEGQSYEMDVRAVMDDGTTRTFHSIGRVSRDENDRPARVSGTFRDITEAHELSQQIASTNEYLEVVNKMLVEQQAELVCGHVQLEALATSDGLTGLKNHRAFQEKIAEEFERAKRYGTELSLILLDVDHFKQFNDSFGHPAGDQVLKRVSSILAQNARVTDLAARYGGEEFAIVLPETDAAGALVIADRIRKAVAEAEWDQRKITVSIGVSALTKPVTAPSTLIDQADTALYASKAAGRDRATLHQLAA